MYSFSNNNQRKSESHLRVDIFNWIFDANRLFSQHIYQFLNILHQNMHILLEFFFSQMKSTTSKSVLGRVVRCEIYVQRMNILCMKIF